MTAGFTVTAEPGRSSGTPADHHRLHVTDRCSELGLSARFYGDPDRTTRWWPLDDLHAWERARCTSCAPTRDRLQQLLDLDTFGRPRRWLLLSSETGEERWSAELLASRLPGGHVGARHAMVPVPVSTLVDLGPSVGRGWTVADTALTPVPDDVADRQVLASTTVALLEEDTSSMRIRQAFTTAAALLDIPFD